MIATNFAAFSRNAGRFHRNVVTIPQVADGDDLNPYTMLTRSQARRRSGDVQMSDSPPVLNATKRSERQFLISNHTLKSRNFQSYGDMKQKQLR